MHDDWAYGLPVKASCAIFLIGTCAFYYGPLSLAYLPLFDRYFLPVVPMAIASVWQGFSATVPSAAARANVPLSSDRDRRSALSPLLLLVYSTAGTHDYLDWNRERWSAVRPIEIDGGWEYNNLLVNEARLYKNYQERGATMTRREREGEIFGEVLDKPYRIAVSPATGYEVIRQVPLSPWLPLTPIELVLMKKVGAPSPAK